MTKVSEMIRDQELARLPSDSTIREAARYMVERGVGSVLGVVPAAIILVMLNPILTAMGINPNNAQVIQGVLIAGVMMVGGLAALMRERAS